VTLYFHVVEVQDKAAVSFLIQIEQECTGASRWNWDSNSDRTSDGNF
jgi:hypothetical protein